jgi:hypothetical protein
MANDAEQRFNIEFAGECLEGHSPEAVRAGLAALFKADAAALERLFSGKRQRIKRDCDKATALKYQKAMTGVGARAIITASAHRSTRSGARSRRSICADQRRQLLQRAASGHRGHHARTRRE